MTKDGRSITFELRKVFVKSRHLSEKTANKIRCHLPVSFLQEGTSSGNNIRLVFGDPIPDSINTFLQACKKVTGHDARTAYGDILGAIASFSAEPTRARQKAVGRALHRTKKTDVTAENPIVALGRAVATTSLDQNFPARWDGRQKTWFDPQERPVIKNGIRFAVYPEASPPDTPADGIPSLVFSESLFPEEKDVKIVSVGKLELKHKDNKWEITPREPNSTEEINSAVLLLLNSYDDRKSIVHERLNSGEKFSLMKVLCEKQLELAVLPKIVALDEKIKLLLKDMDSD